MCFNEILEKVFFRENVKQGSSERFWPFGVYVGNLSWYSGPDINTAVVLVNLS